ncbi:MAG: 50S ribosomal protein L25, partial [Aeoliella sp.]
LRHGAKVVEMQGDEQGQALLQAMQWDTFGRYVVHADLLRIAEGERVHVVIEVETKGQSLGESEGGSLTWVNHAVEIDVAPADIPERLTIDISSVNIGDTVTAADIIDLPADATLLTAPERVLLNCVPPMMEEEEEPSETTGAEPEIIGQKDTEEGDESAGGDS